MAAKKKSKRKDRVSMTAFINRKTVANIQAQADAEGITLSAVVRRTLAKVFGGAN